MTALTGAKGLALFSGGLDSILACKLLDLQGIEIEALHFVSPFFGNQDANYPAEVWDKYQIRVSVIDIAERFLAVLQKPSHGFGRNLNPCIDCKILFLQAAREELGRREAHFLLTGEVLGQRPMSQRRDSLRVIERDSGTADLLIRPLSAQLLAPTAAERSGLVDRNRLLGISGRGRKEQMRLAENLNIKDYPAPAGGCRLTDPILAGRMKKLFSIVAVDDNACRLMQTGRHFLLPDKGWLVLGRNQEENDLIENLARPADVIMTTIDFPGPTGLLRGGQDSHLMQAGALLSRYTKSKKGDPARLSVLKAGSRSEMTVIQPAADDAETLRL